jgi:propionate catabolism operon transcriptional regulator
VFLDAIDRMSPDVQSELFEFLTDQSRQQSGTGDESRERLVRVIAATHSPLLPAIETGTFDEALFYRLNVIHVVADNVEDLPPAAR